MTPTLLELVVPVDVPQLCCPFLNLFPPFLPSPFAKGFPPASNLLQLQRRRNETRTDSEFQRIAQPSGMPSGRARNKVYFLLRYSTSTNIPASCFDTLHLQIYPHPASILYIYKYSPPPPPPCASTAAVPKVQAKQRCNAHPMLRQAHACTQHTQQQSTVCDMRM